MKKQITSSQIARGFIGLLVFISCTLLINNYLDDKITQISLSVIATILSLLIVGISRKRGYLIVFSAIILFGLLQIFETLFNLNETFTFFLGASIFVMGAIFANYFRV